MPVPGPSPSTNHSFWRGLTTPSTLALGVALATIACGVLGAVLLVKPGTSAPALDRVLMGGTWDEFLPTTARALQLPTQDGRRLMLVLGGSVARGAIVESELDRALDARLGEDVHAMQFATARQTLWESIAIIEQLPPTAQGAVLVFVGPTKMLRGTEEIARLYDTPTLGLRSDFVDRQAVLAGVVPPRRTGVYALDNQRFLQQRLTHAVRNSIKAALGRELPEYHFRHPGRALTGNAFDKLALQVQASIESDTAAVARNIAVLDSLVLMVRTRTQMDVVLVESPINPRFVRDYMGQPLYDAYQRQVFALARERNIAYVAMPGLVEADFFDWAHIRSADVGVRYSRALADTLPVLMAHAP